MTYGLMIEYEAQKQETFRREVTYPAAERRAWLLREAALLPRPAIPMPARPLARLLRLAPSR